jgi:hypothetical protein
LAPPRLHPSEFFISALVWIWFVTWGDWKLFEPEDFCGFCDALARSIIHGHLDVPRTAIGIEAFTFEGKTYGYFESARRCYAFR